MEKETKENNVKKSLKYIILSIVLVIFILILMDVIQNEIYEFDNIVYTYIQKYIQEPTTRILKILTNMGGALVLISITIIVMCVVKNKKYGICIAVNLSGVAILNQLLKFIIQRPRPGELYRLVEESGFSFPSGHSMASMAFYGLLIYFAYKNIKNTKLKWFVCILLSIIIFTIGISRIYLGAHYASDVLGGFCLSIIYLSMFIKFVVPKILK